ncbi:ATP-binding protein [Maritimibacter fusiformis]|uniref:histidine kinase n=1 Tax=Maritimibacter fusiformis TaxID=2603819 RepID=A0A5D0RJS4_9RHOB|nr:ATP-binding protein [Maritimibacter fusiformis]TYB81121.1 PAS domain-containing protein [Maritimibacter fusiformis]
MPDAPLTDGTLVQDLISALPAPTLVIDQEERIVALNGAADTLLGRNVVGQIFTAALRHPDLVEAVERCLLDRTPRRTTYRITVNGSDVLYDVHLQAIADTGLLLLSFQNVTDLAQAERMRRDFVANVSHELRTPLASLIGFIETLRGPAREDVDARDRFLNIMADEAGRMNRLVGDLLSLSRVEADERVRPTTRLDLRDVLQTTVQNLDRLAADSGVTLRPQLGSAPLGVLGDADQMLQVFTNLIENAIKYGGENQYVDITAQTGVHDPVLRGPALQIVVADHGPGIDPIHLPRLTERFYRVDSHRSRELGGTGLGLAIVKHILNRHRGRLKATSRPGQGAQFTVILPLLQPET